MSPEVAYDEYLGACAAERAIALSVRDLRAQRAFPGVIRGAEAVQEMAAQEAQKYREQFKWACRAERSFAEKATLLP